MAENLVHHVGVKADAISQERLFEIMAIKQCEQLCDVREQVGVGIQPYIACSPFTRWHHWLTDIRPSWSAVHIQCSNTSDSPIPIPRWTDWLLCSRQKSQLLLLLLHIIIIIKSKPSSLWPRELFAFWWSIPSNTCKLFKSTMTMIVLLLAQGHRKNRSGGSADPLKIWSWGQKFHMSLARVGQVSNGNDYLFNLNTLQTTRLHSHTT